MWNVRGAIGKSVDSEIARRRETLTVLASETRPMHVPKTKVVQEAGAQHTGPANRDGIAGNSSTVTFACRSNDEVIGLSGSRVAMVGAKEVVRSSRIEINARVETIARITGWRIKSKPICPNRLPGV